LASFCSIAVGLSSLGCQSFENPFRRRSAQPPAELAEPSGGTPSTATEAAPPIEPGLPLSPNQRFSDVPLPQGLTEDTDKTFVYEDRTLQVGRMVYTTRAPMNDIAQFYIRECPAAQWKLQNVIQADGQILSFSKPGKLLQVIVRDLGVTKGRQLILTITPAQGP
jgi:hypothetical protein